MQTLLYKDVYLLANSHICEPIWDKAEVLCIFSAWNNFLRVTTDPSSFSAFFSFFFLSHWSFLSSSTLFWSFLDEEQSQVAASTYFKFGTYKNTLFDVCATLLFRVIDLKLHPMVYMLFDSLKIFRRYPARRVASILFAVYSHLTRSKALSGVRSVDFMREEKYVGKGDDKFTTRVAQSRMTKSIGAIFSGGLSVLVVM